MKKFAAIVFLLVLLTLSVTACDEGNCPDGRAWSTRSEEMDEMETLINDARADAGLAPLTRTVLGLVAIEHSKDMACRDFFDHVNPDGKNPADRVEEGLGEDYAPPYRWISENIGAHPTARAQFDSWMASDTHRANILDDRVDEVGLGCVHISHGSAYTDYWTAVFLGRW